MVPKHHWSHRAGARVPWRRRRPDRGHEIASILCRAPARKLRESTEPYDESRRTPPRPMAARISALPQSLPTAPRDGWDVVILVLICAGLSFLLWIALGTPLMDPLLAEARERPSGCFFGAPHRGVGRDGHAAPRGAHCDVDALSQLRAVLRRRRAGPHGHDPGLQRGSAWCSSPSSRRPRRDYPRERLEISPSTTAAKTTPGVYRSAPRPAIPDSSPRCGMRATVASGAALAARLAARARRHPGHHRFRQRDRAPARSSPWRGRSATPGIGAVAGKVAVYNRGRAVIPRMLHVRFILSFDMFCARPQSVYRNVYCCPGALTGLMGVAESERSWIAGRIRSFSGSRCTFGEDRAHDQLSSPTAAMTPSTNAPLSCIPWCRISYAKLCKMLPAVGSLLCAGGDPLHPYRVEASLADAPHGAVRHARSPTSATQWDSFPAWGLLPPAAG